jgi:hypothetical protein
MNRRCPGWPLWRVLQGAPAPDRGRPVHLEERDVTDKDLTKLPPYLTRKDIVEFLSKVFPVSVPQLERWTRLRCPVTEGEPLTRVERPGQDISYPRQQVVEVLEAAMRAKTTGEYRDRDGAVWLQGRVAARRKDLGLSLSFLVTCRTAPTLWLADAQHPAGRCIQTQRVLVLQPRRGGKGTLRRRHFYLLADLEAIAAARRARRQDPGWLTAEEVTEKYGFSEWLLRKWARPSGGRKHAGKRRDAGCPHLRGRRLASRPGKRLVGGKLRRVVEYSTDDLDAISSDRSTLGLAGDDSLVPAAKAVKELGIGRPTLHKWKQHCPPLGKPLVPVRRPAVVCGKVSPQAEHYRRSDIDAINRTNHADAHRQPHRDEEGLWWPWPEAARRCGKARTNFHPFVKAKAPKVWRALGRHLRVKEIPCNGPRIKGGRIRAVHDDDVRQIRGDPPAEPTPTRVEKLVLTAETVQVDKARSVVVGTAADTALLPVPVTAQTAPEPPVVTAPAQEEWLSFSEAVERAAQAEHTITLPWLNRSAHKHGVRTRPRQKPGNHRQEVEWHSLAAYLLDSRKRDGNAEDGGGTAERIEEARRQKRQALPLD